MLDAIKVNSGQAGARGLIRDSNCNRIRGFAISTGICSFVKAEL